MKHTFYIALLTASALTLAACGEKKEADDTTAPAPAEVTPAPAPAPEETKPLMDLTTPPAAEEPKPEEEKPAT